MTAAQLIYDVYFDVHKSVLKPYEDHHNYVFFLVSDANFNYD